LCLFVLLLANFDLLDAMGTVTTQLEASLRQR